MSGFLDRANASLKRFSEKNADNPNVTSTNGKNGVTRAAAVIRKFSAENVNNAHFTAKNGASWSLTAGLVFVPRFSNTISTRRRTVMPSWCRTDNVNA